MKLQGNSSAMHLQTGYDWIQSWGRGYARLLCSQQHIDSLPSIVKILIISCNQGNKLIIEVRVRFPHLKQVCITLKKPYLRLCLYYLSGYLLQILCTQKFQIFILFSYYLLKIKLFLPFSYSPLTARGHRFFM